MMVYSSVYDYPRCHYYSDDSYPNCDEDSYYDYSDDDDYDDDDYYGDPGSCYED